MSLGDPLDREVALADEALKNAMPDHWLLVAIVSTNRYHGEEIDELTAHSEAVALHDEIHDGESNHEEIMKIISTRSKQQHMATFNHFKDIHGTSITKVLKQRKRLYTITILFTAETCLYS
ncbi:hypothetical protein Nepgr_009469 [Nepenthes gracilis]|uniref:Uncharacterized protein n=1 Tax=Nepenthes gracilis TaxID=150966 RepID=A0AAD3SBH9_NEPGR|nr:hypothetical protein Nepgr_009469 [Nepenthes gracilis]